MPRMNRLVEAYVRVDVTTPIRQRMLSSVKTDEQYEEHCRKHYESECASVKRDIIRHVDDVTGVSVEHVYEEVCSFCGAKWTEGEKAAHNGGCCDEDEKIMLAEDAAEELKHAAAAVPNPDGTYSQLD